MIDDDLLRAASHLLDTCRARGLTVAVAESCTGGLVAAALTSIAGSSDVVDRGFVTYSNDAKSEMLGVPPTMIEKCGAVSRDVAAALANGALEHSNADLAVAITGIAGPGGGSAEKPVGLVQFAAAARDGTVLHHEARFGEIGRAGVRRAATLKALELLQDLAEMPR